MLALVALTLTAAVSPAPASEWGTIIAGVSTMDSVRAQYGGPTKAETQKVAAREMNLSEAVIAEAFVRMPADYFKVAAPTTANLGGAIKSAATTGAFKDPPSYDALVNRKFLP